jgi:hypothetical protein
MSARRLRPDIDLQSANTGIHEGDIPRMAHSCVDVTFSENPSVYGLQIQNDRIYRVDVVSASKAETDAGIRLGSTEDDIRKAYGGPAYKGRFVEGNATLYSVNSEAARFVGPDEQAHAFLVKSEDGKRAIVMETDGVHVASMHAGYATVFHRDRFDDSIIWVISCEALLA